MKLNIELRADSVTISGYVNAVERDSRKMTLEDGTPFVEQVRAGVFNASIEQYKNTNAFLNHDKTKMLGVTTDGSLKLKEDNIGLWAELTTQNAEAVEAARNGNLTGWSFGFIKMRDHWDTIGWDAETGHEIKRRYLDEIQLTEVSILSGLIPAYYGTSYEVRAEERKTIEFRANDIEARSIGVMPEINIQFEKRLNSVENKIKLLEKMNDLNKFR